MKKKVVIAGSASLQDRVAHWEHFFTSRGYSVAASPCEISQEAYLKEYPAIHAAFYAALNDTDFVFIMNEDKNGIAGYIGAETFAELAFAVANNLYGKKRARVILLKMPEVRVPSYDEIRRWLQLGWIHLFDPSV